MNSTSFPPRDSATTAVAKNVTVLLMAAIIIYINGTLVHTFRKHQVFYVTPRYILFIHLVVNDMLQLTASVSLFVSSYVFQRVHASVCCVIITVAIFTTFNTPLNLAAMALECHVAVCFPLRHAQLVTIGRTRALIGCIWAASGASVLLDVAVLLATEPRRLFASSLACQRDLLFRHAASLKKRDASYVLCLLAVWATVLYSYFRIICAARAGRGSAAKARGTVALHGAQLLLSMLTYVFHLMVRAVAAWFPRHRAQAVFVAYVTVQVLPRLVSPVVYGLRDHTFKRYLRRYLLCAARGQHKQ